MLAPGQGSQTPGMLLPWLDLPGARDQFSTGSKLTGLDLERLGTTATAEEITDTAVTQPLVVATALLAFDEVAKNGELADDGLAGPGRRGDEDVLALLELLARLDLEVVELEVQAGREAAAVGHGLGGAGLGCHVSLGWTGHAPTLRPDDDSPAPTGTSEANARSTPVTDAGSVPVACSSAHATPSG